ncbi:MAG TPA: hypothetical protein VF681_04865 [Abditibacteriaceae bacterium]
MPTLTEINRVLQSSMKGAKRYGIQMVQEAKAKRDYTPHQLAWVEFWRLIKETAADIRRQEKQVAEADLCTDLNKGGDTTNQ